MMREVWGLPVPTRGKTRNPPMHKGMVASYFLSIVRKKECIVNAFKNVVDIVMTVNSAFTLSPIFDFFYFFLFYYIISAKSLSYEGHFEKRRKIFAKMFGVLKNVVFLQPQ